MRRYWASCGRKPRSAFGQRRQRFFHQTNSSWESPAFPFYPSCYKQSKPSAASRSLTLPPPARPFPSDPSDLPPRYQRHASLPTITRSSHDSGGLPILSLSEPRSFLSFSSPHGPQPSRTQPPPPTSPPSNTPYRAALLPDHPARRRPKCSSPPPSSSPSSPASPLLPPSPTPASAAAASPRWPTCPAAAYVPCGTTPADCANSGR